MRKWLRLPADRAFSNCGSARSSLSPGVQGSLGVCPNQPSRSPHSPPGAGAQGVEKNFAQSPRRLRREGHTRRRLAANDHSSNRLHQIEGRTKNRKIVAIKEVFGAAGNACAVLTARDIREPCHAPTALCFQKGDAATRLPGSPVAPDRSDWSGRWELFHRNGSASTKVVKQKWLQPGQIEFFACPHGSGLIAKCHHTRKSCLSYQ
jgi:hypothetical protein